MAYRARASSYLQLGIRYVLVCVLGIVSTIEAQTSLGPTPIPPAVVSSVAPEPQSSLPPGGVKGTKVFPAGFTITESCEPGKSLTTFSTYAACCARGSYGDFAVGCDGSTLLFDGKPRSTCGGKYPDCWGTTIFDSFPSTTRSWVEWECVTSTFGPAYSIFYYVDEASLSSYFSYYDDYSQYYSTVKSTQYTTATRTMGTSVYTTVIPVTSSSGSEDVSSTTTGEPAPAPSDPFNEDPVLEKYFRPPSKAWIAGAVAGPLLALIAGGCFVFWLRRHKQRKRLVESGGSGPGINVNDLPCIQAEFVQPSSEVAKTFDTTPPSMCELEATEVVHQGPFQGTTTGTGGAMRL